MPVYRVFINKRDTHTFIATTNLQVAYEDLSDFIFIDFNDHLDLKLVNSSTDLEQKHFKGRKLCQNIYPLLDNLNISILS